MSLLKALHALLGQHPQAAAHPMQQAGQLMEVGANGAPVPSNQGYLPPTQQQDTWMSNDPRAMRPPMHHLNRLIHGGSPQGFPGSQAYAPAPQPNFQQGIPMDGMAGVQGVQNPGFTPMQGSRAVSDIAIQGSRRRSRNISF